MKISRGDIFSAKLEPVAGHEIGKTRPVIIVSNNVNNEFAKTVTVVPVSSQRFQKVYPFEMSLKAEAIGISTDSKAKADQIRTLDKSRLLRRLGALDKIDLSRLDAAIRIHLGL